MEKSIIIDARQVQELPVLRSGSRPRQKAGRTDAASRIARARGASSAAMPSSNTQKRTQLPSQTAFANHLLEQIAQQRVDRGARRTRQPDAASPGIGSATTICVRRIARTLRCGNIQDLSMPAAPAARAPRPRSARNVGSMSTP